MTAGSAFIRIARWRGTTIASTPSTGGGGRIVVVSMEASDDPRTPRDRPADVARAHAVPGVPPEYRPDRPRVPVVWPRTAVVVAMSTFFIGAANETDTATEEQDVRGEGGTGAPEQDNDRTHSYHSERLRCTDSDRRRPIEGCSWREVASECHVAPGR